MRSVVVFFSALLVSGCIDGFISDNEHQLRRTFIASAEQHDVPASAMLASAWLESRLTSVPSVVMHEEKSTGVGIGETVFGLRRAKLYRFGDRDNESLEHQVVAYARLVRAHLDEKGLDLDTNFDTVENKIAWLWELAEIHRRGDRYHTNIRSLFVLEMIHILNTGFEWRETENNEHITLLPWSPKIDRSQLSRPQQQLLNLKTAEAQLYQAQWLHPDEPTSTQNVANSPQRILITHCPFSLSGCLELQQDVDAENDDARLQAHYLIPADGTVLSYPVQVAHHHKQVTITNHKGQHERQKDTIVIMLTGNSGRLNANVRFSADPSWQSGFQLEWLGYMVKELCAHHLGLRNEEQIKNCSDPYSSGSRVSLRVESQSTSLSDSSPAEYVWGEIPDFDRSIYGAYLQNPQQIQLEFVYPDKRRNFAPGENIDLLLPDTGRNYHILEKLARCRDNQRLVWVTVSQGESDNNTFAIKLYDQGANGDGRQFLRAKIFRQGTLIAWATTSLWIDGHDQETEHPFYEKCDTRAPKLSRAQR